MYHDSGSAIICKDKARLDKDAVRKKLSKSLKRNYYYIWREWPYKDVPRRIIAEEYIKDLNQEDLYDYKFFCFNGKCKYCQVIKGRDSIMTIDFFDKEWRHQPFHEPSFYPFSNEKISPPKRLSLMWELSEILSWNCPFARIDFYEVNSRIYFGEITLYPTSGIGGFSPTEWDYNFGEMIELPEI